MALPTASDNEFPKVILEEVANDGSATTTPAADHRALFLGEDGGLHLKDSAAAVTDIVGASAHIADTTDAHDASAVSFDPTGLSNTAATELQTAMEDFDAAIDGAAGGGGVVERDYAERTTNFTTSVTTEGTAAAVITGAAVSYDGSTVVEIEWTFPSVRVTSGSALIELALYDGSSSIGIIGRVSSASAGYDSIAGKRRLTPSNASHTYSIRVFTSAGTAELACGSGGSGSVTPGRMRIVEV